MKIFILSFMVSIILSLKSKMKVLQDQSSESSTISCVGNAGYSLAPNRVKIDFNIISKNLLAKNALADNVKISNAVIKALTKLGVIPENDIQTTSYSVNPQYSSVYNNDTQSYDSIFNGYQVSNYIQVTSLSMKSTAKLIANAVKAGASVSAVNFDVTEDVVKKANMDLLKSTIEDCNLQIKNTLEPINYQSGDYIYINIGDMQGLFPRSIPVDAFSSSTSEPSIFTGKIKISTKIDLKVKISSK